MSLDTAVAAIRARAESLWPSLEAAVPLSWPNENQDGAGNPLPPRDANGTPSPFVRIGVMWTGGGFLSIGNGLKRREGQIWCEAFIPEGSGEGAAHRLATEAARMFEGKHFGVVVCWAMQPGGPVDSEDGNFYGQSASVPFHFDEPSLYTAQAVHFDGATWLINAALASSDNGTASCAYFFKNETAVLNSQTVWVSDPSGLDDQSSYISQVALNGANSDYGTTGSDYVYIHGGDAIAASTWYFLIESVDLSGGSPVFRRYLGDVAQSPIIDVTGTPIGVLPFNGSPLYVGDDGVGGASWVGDIANLWIAPGVSLLDGVGDIPLATRRKFIDGGGKPVYLGANGELPTGTAPAVFLSASAGNAASFATNRGTGGAFATTGTLTLASGP